MHTHNVFYCGLTIVVLVTLLLLAASLPGTAAPTAYPAAADADWQEVRVGSASGGGISDNSDNTWGPSVAIAPDGGPYVAWYDNNDGDPDSGQGTNQAAYTWNTAGNQTISVSNCSGNGNSANSTDLTFATSGTSVPSSIVSDDFNMCSLNTGLWTWTDPRGDASYAMMGTFTQDAWLSISVPAGTDHDIREDGNFAPRIMQPISDTDFEIEVKFESGVSQQFQMQGVLVEEGSDDFLRFDFHSDGTNTKIFAASFTDGTPLQRVNSVITDTHVAPLYMRVRRQGDQWTQSYSFDGEDWTTLVTFTHPLTVTAAGTYAGNAVGASSPAHTAYIDYFFNTASPITPEDGDRNTLTVYTVGDGTVTKDPGEDMYDCDEEVTLIATADPDWTFSGWSGDLSGSTNPVTVTMTGSRVITATFTQGEYTLTVNVVGNGAVVRDPDQSSYTYGQVVTLTATVDLGWAFDNWSGDLSGSDNPETVTMYGHRTVTATFDIASSGKVYLPLVMRGYCSCGPDNYEPNDSFAQAYGPLTSDQTYHSYISCCDVVSRRDYFYIDISTTNPIEVDLTNIPAGVDYDLYLYNASQVEVARSWKKGNVPEHISHTPAGTGRYYILVFSPYAHYSANPYSLRVTYD